jgi:hypothetical protein
MNVVENGKLYLRKPFIFLVLSILNSLFSNEGRAYKLWGLNKGTGKI